MTLTQSLLIIVLLIALSAFFSLAEITLAASRRLRLRQMADEGDPRAEKVLRVQEQPGHYFTVVQIGLNAVAILGGVVGEGSLSPYFAGFFERWLSVEASASVAFLCSFVIVIAVFLVFADLFPKRLGMSNPEQLAVRMVGPMQLLITTFKPLVWFFTRCTDLLFKVLGMPMARDDKITSADILAMTEAGARAGVLAVREQQVIANVFELETRLVSSVMTARDSIAWFLHDDPETVLRARIVAEPFSAYPVCDGDIDHVLGYVDAKDMFQRVLSGQPLAFDQGLPLHKALVIPDRLSLTEVLEQFQQAHEDFAIIVNEYSLVVGVITLNDVMSTVMGDLVSMPDEEQIVQRDENSWLIDGVTPIQDVQRALHIDELPHPEEYETLAGFLMVMLRRVPKRTDNVTWGGYTFEVMDVDSYRIDQVMVTKGSGTAKAPAG
ncbi:Hemolysin, contains CBS domains [Variovorax sp. OK605]|jgi:CBS domain containing-hemolysin-like protein|uniref:hemolysin family protein n=1 Tax=unclassified Variovorax TaxID=663243 RepID=UPI0008C7098D|nr:MULTISPECIES: hemolysin family protein [unclassified Variovorax]SEK13693.1 Hemolysin, contains CBS domains [Variovorax sp. OK202]SFD90793.1 Hemolysin, contains CBS domains [Variovorax sp. OK212]SFQ65701.1 Hemolysin, contains CBS domains [Variovorax sp. OK605]